MATVFVTAPSTPEIQGQRRDALEMVVQRRLGQDDGDGSGGMTIFRVPAHFREASKELYEPRLVSIGPYYRGREALRAMEQHKWRYLRELVARRPEASLADYVAAVRAVEQRAWRCYAERTSIFDAVAAAQAEPSGGGIEGEQSPPGNPMADDFAEMLLLDGCFILQFFIKWNCFEHDELCEVGWGLKLLRSDLLLLENQIPFFVLEALFGVAIPEAERVDLLRRLILPHLSLDDSIFSRDESIAVPTREALWFLPRLLRRRLQGLAHDDTADLSLRLRPHPDLAVPSVTMLHDAGVQFRLKTSPQDMFDITFDKAKGVMRMPRIQVGQANTPLLVNIIAFEQTTGGPCTSFPLSSYAALMGFLVKIGKDVEHLKKRPGHHGQPPC
ncbi:hypothetical protein EJB05_25110, partial [Eragrostis curvula]